MTKITIFDRSLKDEGDVRLRFYLSDGRGVRLYHQSSITARQSELKKYNLLSKPDSKLRRYEPQLRRGVTVYDRELMENITKEVSAMDQAYKVMYAESLPITTDMFNSVIESILYPKRYAKRDGKTIIDRLNMYINEAIRDGVFGEARAKHYRVLMRSVERFLTVSGQVSLLPENFNTDTLLQYRQFLFDEYKWVDQWPQLYQGTRVYDAPTKPRNANTVTSTLKMLQAFFTELESIGVIERSPFKQMSTERKKAIMKTKYDTPIFLRREELHTLMNASVPDDLRDTKDAFLLHCALGCRVSDFCSLSFDNVSISPDGIPYVHYLPQKTKGGQTDNTEVQTPLVRYAFDIIRRTSFVFPILRNVCGSRGYNNRIKELLKVCGIDRKVAVFNHETNENDYLPLYKLGSSKLCRKTYVDITSKIQIDLYAGGLHKQGSDAVHRYTEMELSDRFSLLSYAFGQQPYKADRELNIINECV